MARLFMHLNVYVNRAVVIFMYRLYRCAWTGAWWWRARREKLQSGSLPVRGLERGGRVRGMGSHRVVTTCAWTGAWWWRARREKLQSGSLPVRGTGAWWWRARRES